jgi:erythromycin esterase-like protein
MTRPTPVEQETARQDAKLAGIVKQHARPLSEGNLAGYDPLLDMIGNARIVMIGDGSHGTHEFYRERALITKRLIEEQGFTLPLNEWRGNRAIGVQYHPESEWHNYVPTKLAGRYDAFVHIDRTRAVKPLDMSAAKPESVPRWEAEMYPEGY